jgi:uncharacterized protein YbaP (TraB family)
MLKFATFCFGSLLSFAAAANPLPQTSPPEHHALWSLQGKSNTVYLLGSVHFLRPSDQLPDVVDDAYRSAGKLVMELDMDDLDPATTQQTTLDLGLLPDNKTLESELGRAAYLKVARQARSIGLDLAVLNHFRPWLAAMTLVQLQLVKQGLDPASGVEQRLVARAAADHKEIIGLETLQEQLGLLANLPQQQQREFLMYSVDDADRADQEIEELITAWRNGDTHALEQILAAGFEKYPDLYRPLTVERNRKWIPDIEKLLDDRDDYLVVVGTMHLVGKDSVIDLLESSGHKVTQH